MSASTLLAAVAVAALVAATALAGLDPDVVLAKAHIVAWG